MTDAAVASPPAASPAHGPDQEPVTIVERSPTTLELLRTTWEQRRLLGWFAARVVVKRYAVTRLGRAWLVLRVIIPLFGFTLLFGTVLKAPSNEAPYLLFLVVGFGAWQSFDRVLYFATRSLDRYRRLSRNLVFPMLAIPIGGVGLAMVETVIYVVIGAGAVAYYAIAEDTMYLNTGPELLAGVAAFVLAWAFGTGLSLYTSLLNVKARDTALVTRYVLQIWLFVTPVFYPVEALPNGLRFLATINPVAPIVELAKWGFIDAGEVRPLALAISMTVTAVVLVSGLAVFARKAPWAWRGDILVEDDEEEEMFGR